ncbi:MAG: hypothetical protein L0G99_09160 [Propionibacteriales bacterium]|nr:hypothetical protein [Propionibacteriales bacterium]
MSTITRTNPARVVEQRFVIITCCRCYFEFGMPETMYERVTKNHSDWYCPNGHAQHFTGKTEEERLREEVTFQRGRAKSWQDQATQNEARRRAEKAAKTRIRNRIAQGVCPCCKRSFVDMQRHIEGQHPEFGGDR